jgi:hypothetical protein
MESVYVALDIIHDNGLNNNASEKNINPVCLLKNSFFLKNKF